MGVPQEIARADFEKGGRGKRTRLRIRQSTGTTVVHSACVGSVRRVVKIISPFGKKGISVDVM